jgi:hypothetical protein
MEGDDLSTLEQTLQDSWIRMQDSHEYVLNSMCIA